MGEARLHVVFGTGQVGSALAAHLAWRPCANASRLGAFTQHQRPAQ
jgi:hypothetical protein